MPYPPGMLFHDLTLREYCGGGAYGEVYLVRDISGKISALKIIPKNKGGDSWKRELHGLIRYRQLCTDSPCLLKINLAGEDSDCFYYTMDPADNAGNNGTYAPDTLARRLDQGPLPLPQIPVLAKALLSGLEELHRAGLLHGDLKPANILYIHGEPVIGDIGLLRSESSLLTHLAGTMEFIPPEVRKNPRTAGAGTVKGDLYAVGMVLYCAMTGYSPDRFPELPPKLLENKAAAPLNKLICRACSQDPFLRFESCEEFQNSLEELSGMTGLKSLTTSVCLRGTALRKRFASYVSRNLLTAYFLPVLLIFAAAFFRNGNSARESASPKEKTPRIFLGPPSRTDHFEPHIEIEIPKDWKIVANDLIRSEPSPVPGKKRLTLSHSGEIQMNGHSSAKFAHFSGADAAFDWNDDALWKQGLRASFLIRKNYYDSPSVSAPSGGGRCVFLKTGESSILAFRLTAAPEDDGDRVSEEFEQMLYSVRDTFSKEKSRSPQRGFKPWIQIRIPHDWRVERNDIQQKYRPSVKDLCGQPYRLAIGEKTVLTMPDGDSLFFELLSEDSTLFEIQNSRITRGAESKMVNFHQYSALKVTKEDETTCYIKKTPSKTQIIRFRGAHPERMTELLKNTKIL